MEKLSQNMGPGCDSPIPHIWANEAIRIHSLGGSLGLLQDFSDKRQKINLLCVERRECPGQDFYSAFHCFRSVHKDLIGPSDFTQTSPNGKLFLSQFFVDNLNTELLGKLFKILQNLSGLHVYQPLAARFISAHWWFFGATKSFCPGWMNWPGVILLRRHSSSNEMPYLREIR